MAVDLQKGGYALQHQQHSNKVVIQLKLTDSALRSFELFQNSFETSHRFKPSIKFDGNQGIIQIPSRERGAPPQAYTFQSSTLPQSAAIDCLQQNSSKSSTGSVSVMGEILQKITVHANDDTYNATRKRMEKVKEREKNISTKVIKQPSNSKISGRKKIFGRQLHDLSPNSSPGKLNHSFPRSVSPLSSSTTDSLVVRNKTKPILSSLSSTSSSPSRIVAGKPLQEKILHYVAIRPIKFNDLITRLSRGVSHVEKERVKSMLNQMATVNSSGEYTLTRGYLVNVNIDWPGYHDEEKTNVRRNLEFLRFEKNKKRTFSSPPNNSPSPSQLIAQEEEYSNPLKKKARVSLYKKSSPPLSHPDSISPHGNDQPLLISHPPSVPLLSSSTVVDLNKLVPGNDVIGSHSSRHKHSDRRKDKNNQNARGSNPAQSTVTTDSTSMRPPKNSRYRDQRPFRSDSVKESQNNNEAHSSMYETTIIPSPEDSSLSSAIDYEEFKRKYQPITFDDDRNRYEEDFYAEYKEYLDLHHELSAQSQRFAKWEVELEHEEQYTDRYKELARLVFNEYCQLMEDGVYLKQRRRFSYLYPKLKHIKNLVLEYDRKQYGSQSDTNAASF